MYHNISTKSFKVWSINLPKGVIMKMQ